jgi:hypothetical protein
VPITIVRPRRSGEVTRSRRVANTRMTSSVEPGRPRSHVLLLLVDSLRVRLPPHALTAPICSDYATAAGYTITWKKYITTMQISQFVIDLFVVYFACMPFGPCEPSQH